MLLRAQAKDIIRTAFWQVGALTPQEASTLADRLMRETGMRRAFWATLTSMEKMTFVLQIRNTL